MKLTFLGTGAADWDINAYEPDKEFRRFSAALVNDDLLIDPGPHIFHFARSTGRPEMFDGVRNIIVTHTHADHFCPATVETLCLGKPCTLWGDRACLRILKQTLGPEKTAQIDFRETFVRMPEPYRIGNYNIRPLRSNHATDDSAETTRLYIIEETEPERRILYYGCDSAWIPTESWNVIKTLPVNVLVLEDTCGELATDDWRIFEHNTIEMLELMLRMFRKYGCFAPDVRYYTSHMARTLHTDHQTLVKKLAPLGVTPAQDGLTITI